MCALRCQLTVRIEGGPGPAGQPALTLSVLRAPSPRHLIQSHSFNSFNNCHLLLVLSVDIKKSLVVYLQELHRMSVRQKVGLYQIELPAECMSLCVYVCAVCHIRTHMAPFVSHQVGSHTLYTTPHSSTKLHTTPHNSTKLHTAQHGERARTRGRRPLLLPTFAPTECIGCITYMQNASTIASHTNTINTRTLAKKTSTIHNKQAQRTTN